MAQKEKRQASALTLAAMAPVTKKPISRGLGRSGAGNSTGSLPVGLPAPLPVALPTPSSAVSTLGAPLDIRGVAHLIGCSPWTVRQTLIPQGLPVFRSGASGKLIFYTAQVVRWIENKQKEG